MSIYSKAGAVTGFASGLNQGFQNALALMEMKRKKEEGEAWRKQYEKMRGGGGISGQTTPKASAPGKETAPAPAMTQERRDSLTKELLGEGASLSLKQPTMFETDADTPMGIFGKFGKNLDQTSNTAGAPSRAQRNTSRQSPRAGQGRGRGGGGVSLQPGDKGVGKASRAQVSESPMYNKRNQARLAGIYSKYQNAKSFIKGQIESGQIDSAEEVTSMWEELDVTPELRALGERIDRAKRDKDTVYRTDITQEELDEYYAGLAEAKAAERAEAERLSREEEAKKQDEERRRREAIARNRRMQKKRESLDESPFRLRGSVGGVPWM